jgi:hypothetical protein
MAADATRQKAPRTPMSEGWEASIRFTEPSAILFLNRSATSSRFSTLASTARRPVGRTACLAGLFIEQRFSKFPRFTPWCSESMSYVRIRCPTLVQDTPVRKSLCNYCATKKATVFQTVGVPRAPRNRQGPGPLKPIPALLLSSSHGLFLILP